MRKEQALDLIRNDQRLVEIARYEPNVLYHIVDLALLKSDQPNRWMTYEELKALASQIAGWHSDHPELATSRHYEALIQCIDAILPVEPLAINPYADEIEDDDEEWW